MVMENFFQLKNAFFQWKYFENANFEGSRAFMIAESVKFVTFVKWSCDGLILANLKQQTVILPPSQPLACSLLM